MDDVARWRKEKRRELIALRVGTASQQRAIWSAQLTTRLHAVLDHLVPGILGAYWPIQSEFDPRPLIDDFRLHGWQMALPVVVAKNEPLEYRTWSPGDVLERGPFGIMEPRNGTLVLPDALLVPCVGYDDGLFRLGNGGGFFDRTLPQLASMPLAVGVAFTIGRLDTIYPQPHDRPMDVIVTETGVLR
ncbi:MAG TPA: 5-formyltetrahydrofolate cyclo-ligase [Magnetospirillaceae bacterium]|jgi:5-formyltetrahydrofolate cyclo-ligase